MKLVKDEKCEIFEYLGKNASWPANSPLWIFKIPLTVSFLRLPQSGRFSSIIWPLKSDAAIKVGPAFKLAFWGPIFPVTKSLAKVSTLILLLVRYCWKCTYTKRMWVVFSILFLNLSYCSYIPANQLDSYRRYISVLHCWHDSTGKKIK